MAIGLAGGSAASARGRAWWRGTCGAFAVVCVVIMVFVASDTAPLATAHGAWVGSYAASLVAVLCLACAIPQRIGQPSFVPGPASVLVIGAVCGIAWSAAVREVLWVTGGPHPAASWWGTFLGVLLPGAVTGAALTCTQHARWTGQTRGRRWYLVAPPLLAGALTTSSVLAWALTATHPGPAWPSLTTARGAWVAVLAAGLLATLVIAVPRWSETSRGRREGGVKPAARHPTVPGSVDLN